MTARGLSALLGVFFYLAANAAFAQSADLTVLKTAPTFAGADTDVSYGVTLTNLGPDPAASVMLSDPLPAGLTFVGATQDSGPAFTCSTPAVGAGGTITCSVATLASGASAAFTLVAHVPPATPPATFFTNIASVSSETFDPGDENDSSAATTATPSSPADVSLIKNGPPAAGPDTDIAYSIVLANAGPADAQTVSWTDTLPGNLTFVSLAQTGGPVFACTTPAAGAGGTVACNFATLPNGAGASFTLTAHVPPGTPGGTGYANNATVSSAQDPTEKNNTGVATTTVSSTDVSVTKTGPATVVAGQQIVYTITLANAGPDTAISASFQDILPANATFVSLVKDSGPTFNCTTPGVGAGGAVSCLATTLAAAASAQFTLTVQLDAVAPNGSTFANTATADSASFDSAPGNNTSTASATVANTADVGVTKTGSATAGAGQNASYTIVLSNAGPDAAVNAHVDDTLPAGTTFQSLTQTAGPTLGCTTPAVGAGGTVTCGVASLASGASATLTLTVQIPANATNGSTVTNTATAASDTPDSSTGNNSASTSATVDASADLSVTKTGPVSVLPGGNASYTLTVANAGPGAASNVVLTDTMPAQTTFVSIAQDSGPGFSCSTPAVGGSGAISCTGATLASGASATFTLVLQLQAGTSAGTNVVNGASVASDTPDSNPANNSANASSVVSVSADLQVTKTGPATFTAGQTASYTITVANVGQVAADAVQLNDALPAVTRYAALTQTSGPAFACTTPAVGTNGSIQCNLASLAPAASATFDVSVSVPAGTPDGTAVVNTATATTTSADPDPANNTSSTTGSVANAADLVMGKTGPATYTAGQDATYTLSLVNNGGAPADNVQIADTLPANTTFASLTQTAGPTFVCTTPAAGNGGSVVCTIASFAPGAAATFSLVVHTAAGATGTVSNTATATTTSTEASVANNAATSSGAFDAVAEFVPVPALSTWMLALLGALLGAVGLRRRALARIGR